jgi:hypothetical protein
LCQSHILTQILDLGEQPFSTGLPLRHNEPLRMFELKLLQCETCGLLQLRRPANAADLTPFGDWVTYREPESHLDAVFADLIKLDGFEKTSRLILGATSKDDSFLERFVQLGFTKARRLDLVHDLAISRSLANVEAVPDALTAERGAAITRQYGKAQLVICRHILEHAASLRGFIAGLTALVAPDGYLMLEVPDCQANITRGDYTMLWEEHSVYFTPATFFQLLQSVGFTPALMQTYPYPYENCLILVARRGADVPLEAGSPATLCDLSQERLVARQYGARFDDETARLRERLTEAAARKPVALYGAGHLTAAFVNYHGLADLFDCVVDDTPQKQGLLLPGSGLPVLPSTGLLERGIGLCLLGLAPEVEAKVIARHTAFTAGGGEFASILVASERHILREDGQKWRYDLGGSS